jgi:hypothetical protein
MLSAAYVRTGWVATTVLAASVLTPLFAPDPITLALQVIAGVLFVVAFRHMPPELRRRMLRELRPELILGCISVLGLSGMAAFGRFVPDEMRGPVGLLWLWIPLAFVGMLMVRIVRIVATHARRARA